MVIATTFDSDEHVQIALRNGAAGFILKDSGPHLLLEAIRAAAAGDALISPSITVRYLDRFINPATTPAHGNHPLSERELDVARAVARGLGNQEIAAELFISLSTVKTHLTSIQTKLHLRNRVADRDLGDRTRPTQRARIASLERGEALSAVDGVVSNPADVPRTVR